MLSQIDLSSDLNPTDLPTSVVRRYCSFWPQADCGGVSSPFTALTAVQAAAPQPPEIISTESASTSSLVDVDTPSVRTVPSDFGEQDIQTETQKARRDREEEQRRAESDLAKKKANGKAKARKADSFLTKWFGDINDEASTALVISNLVGVVGLSGFLGYKAWDLHARNRLSWQSVGLGLGIMGVVGAAEGVFGRYLYKGKKNQS